MAENENGYVSVIGQALIQPIFHLVDKLESKEPVPPNEVQTGQRENGYSLAIVALSAMLFESALNRTAYVRQEEEENRRPADYFKKISSEKDAAAEAEEVFAVRNVIAHNHLWEGTTTWTDDDGGLGSSSHQNFAKATATSVTSP